MTILGNTNIINKHFSLYLINIRIYIQIGIQGGEKDLIYLNELFRKFTILKNIQNYTYIYVICRRCRFPNKAINVFLSAHSITQICIMDTLVQTFIHTLREAPVTQAQAWTKNQRNSKIDFCQTFVRVVYPVFFLVFILILWLVGLIYYIVL